MFPEEIQAVMAKVLFLIFAIFVLCFSKARATSLEGEVILPSKVVAKTVTLS